MTLPYLDAFTRAADPENPSQVWISPYTAPPTTAEHQFVLFLKPEATAVHEGVQLDKILGLVFERLNAFGVTLHAARALPAAYLEAHAVMDNHYGVINRISKQGVEALTDDARAKLEKHFAEALAAGARVLGGHQFLAEQPAFSALALSTLNDNLGTTKLGGGSYAMTLNVLGQHYILLNPFHAYQLVPYTTPGRAILVFEGRSTRDWAELRGTLTGSTDPAKAKPESIRAALRVGKEALGLKEVSQGMNGIHLSAGPLEGMVELKRFFSDPEAGQTLDWSDLAFGRALASKGLDPDALAQNPDLERGGRAVSAFDLTEECNAVDALGLLA